MEGRRIALVTGSNRGIGLGIADGLLRDGYFVIVCSRNLDAGKLALEYLDEYHDRIDLMQLDVSDQENIRKAAKYVSKTYGRLDVLVNNAGIIGQSKAPLKEGDVKEVKRVMKTNFYGPMRMSTTFLPLLRKGSDARIINVSSGMGAIDDLFGGYAAYRLSKAGLNAQTILMANDLISEGIRVFAMCPGWVRTEMGGGEASRSVEQGADTAVWLANAPEAETGKFYRDRRVIPW